MPPSIPGDPNPLDSIAELYIRKGKLDEAAAKYREDLDVQAGFLPLLRDWLTFTPSGKLRQVKSLAGGVHRPGATNGKNGVALAEGKFYGYFLGRWEKSWPGFVALRKIGESYGAALSRCGDHRLDQRTTSIVIAANTTSARKGFQGSGSITSFQQNPSDRGVQRDLIRATLGWVDLQGRWRERTPPRPGSGTPGSFLHVSSGQIRTLYSVHSFSVRWARKSLWWSSAVDQSDIHRGRRSLRRNFPNAKTNAGHRQLQYRPSSRTSSPGRTGKRATSIRPPPKSGSS